MKHIDHSKSKELIILISNRLGNKENYGATVLNKALYFIDNIHYLKTGKPISNFNYIKQDHGPTPEPSQFLALREEMITSGEVEMVNNNFFGRIQSKLIAKRKPKISLFTKEENKFIEELLKQIEDLNATQISEIAHKFPAWKAAGDKESLPLFTFLLSSKSPTNEDIEWARKVIRKRVSSHSSQKV